MHVLRTLLKIIGWTVVVVIALPLLAVVVLWAGNRITLGGADDTRVAYLHGHAHVLSLKASGADDMPDLFREAKDTRIFLLGEQHGIAEVQLFDAALFKHLVRTQGVRHYVAEMDSIRARQLNAYLSSPTKDDALLREVVLAIAQTIPQQSSRELMEKWSGLYDFNRGLADSLRIEVIGVDVAMDGPSGSVDREHALFLNFQEEVRKRGLEGAKFHGFFGYYHVLQDGIAGGGRPFAAQLKDAGYAVHSIVCHALDSEVRMPKNDRFPTPPDEKLGMLNSDGPFILLEGINDLKAATAPNSVTLFDLDAEGSPYRNGQSLVRMHINLMGNDLMPDGDRPTTEYFQQVLLLRNAAALSPVPQPDR